MTRATNDLEDDRNGYDIFCSKGTHFSPEGPVREVLTLLRQEKPVLSFEAASTDTGMSFRSCPFGPQLSTVGWSSQELFFFFSPSESSKRCSSCESESSKSCSYCFCIAKFSNWALVIKSFLQTVLSSGGPTGPPQELHREAPSCLGPASNKFKCT